MAKDESGDADTTSGVSLEQVITSLQKSFSRVSRDAAQVGDDEALALIVGNVDFEIRTRVTPVGDQLIVDKEGEVDLNLRGVVDTDLREESGSYAPDAGDADLEESVSEPKHLGSSEDTKE